jgi:hypothetical protein
MLRIPPKKMLSRDEASTYLSEMGMPVTKGTLATWASAGQGPPYLILRKRAVYFPKDLDDWVDTQLKQPVKLAIMENAR